MSDGEEVTTVTKNEELAAVTPVTQPSGRPKLLLALLVLVALSTLVTPFRRDLFVGDETKYGQVVREMRATGAFFLPTLGGVPFTHKPPVHFWLIDFLTFPLGVYSMWAFVLPSLVAFALLLWFMKRIGGTLAAFVCGTSILIWASAQTARMDVSFTLLIGVGLWLLERFFDRDDFRALLWSGVCLGVATLIKGPMAPIIGIVLFLLEWWRRRRAPRGNYAPSVLAMIAIPLAWFIPAMLMGGSAYTHEVIVKQTVGRAFATWVHKAPPWFYLEHFPATLAPWFFAGVVAVAARWRRQRFLVNWILAVVLPYSIMSSKLDVYMMAMIPPLALLIADAVDVPALRIANAITIAFAGLIGVAGFFVQSKEPEAVLLQLPAMKAFLIFTIVIAAIALVVALRSSIETSTLLAGCVPVAMFLFIAFALMPVVNDIASTRRLVAALERQHLPPEQIALYTCPYLWTRDMPRELERVIYADPDTFKRLHPTVIATARGHANEIAPALAGYRRVDELRMIGKWFDVDRR